VPALRPRLGPGGTGTSCWWGHSGGDGGRLLAGGRHEFLLYDDGTYVWQNTHVTLGLDLDGRQMAFAAATGPTGTR